MRPFRHLLLPALILIGCSANGDANGGDAVEAGAASQGQAQGRPFQSEPVAQFNEPWAMAFLPGGRQALVTEKPGTLKLWSVDGGGTVDVAGVPAVDYGGQGGLGDVVLHPGFA